MTHIKYAGAVEDALKSIADKAQLHKHPFESIFSTMLPMMLWPTSKSLTALVFIGEALGYGPGLIGEYIDKKLGFHSGMPDLSEGNLKKAATDFVDMILAKLGLKSESFLEELYMSKQSIELEDLVSIAAMSKSRTLTKMAYPGRIQFLRRFLGKVGKGGRIGLINGLWAALKQFAKGLLGLGIATGVVSKIKEKKDVLPDYTTEYQDIEKEDLLQLKQPDLTSGKLIPYSNVLGNVEESLIEHLKDIKISYKGDKISLPTYFQKEKIRPLKGSPEMEALMEKSIFPYNKVLTDPVFIAPKIKDLAKQILPHIIIANLFTNVKYV